MSDIGALSPRLIVGLGNPGGRYDQTRHNVGFEVLDRLAGLRGFDFVQEKKWEVKLAREQEVGEGSPRWFAKPQTFMNLSGRAVAGVARFYQIPPEEILVVYDDVSLALGTLRFRMSGSAGGHNGMRSIIECLGGGNFPRLKLGIAGERGRPTGNAMSSHVLGRFASEEKESVTAMLDGAVLAIEFAIREGLGAAMNRFNQGGGGPAEERPGKEGGGQSPLQSDGKDAIDDDSIKE